MRVQRLASPPGMMLAARLAARPDARELQDEGNDRANAHLVVGVGVGKVAAHDLLLLPRLPPQTAAQR